MSVFQKNDENDSSLLGVVFFAFLFAFIGALSGFLLLASIPLKSFESLAELEKFTENNSQISLLKGYCFKGPVTLTPDLIEKREAFLNGNNLTIELTDGEINAWITSEFSKPRSTFSLKDRPGVLILPDLPNFFINETVGITFRIPIEIVIYGKEHHHLMIVQGRFIENEESPLIRFQTEVLSINDAKIPLFNGLSDRLMVDLLQPFLNTDEFIDFMKAWEKIDSIEIVADKLFLNLN